MDNCNQNTEHDRQCQNQQQQQRHGSNCFKAPEERPYRRRIKPPPDKVHHVQTARFRHFVQKHTCCLQLQPQQRRNVPPPGSNSDDAAAATSTTTSAATEQQVLQPPPDAAIGSSSSNPATGAGRLNVTRKSMQDAYMAWCSSNGIPLSPGTMAELRPPS
ncbi:hypothetical protein BS78_01G249900 [Paspalum vaginatum]|uniref:VQ domain-containing protein n=1 Tax=Paspalum vaginatum TaxID=158149 RepID=A0A9W7XB96_9POAL|nr:hypothetical protein BS78_K163800 [Paspalum vaginatum]KAJ1295794.1 hypothetical protein BS78_01G249900 [Paspalum vaginatum]